MPSTAAQDSTSSSSSSPPPPSSPSSPLLRELLPPALVRSLHGHGPSTLTEAVSTLASIASLALPPRFAGEVSTIMGGGSDGLGRQGSGASAPTGVAVGVLMAPLLAASRLARAMGIDLSPEDMGFDSRDVYHSPASAAARLDSIQLLRVRAKTTSSEPNSNEDADQASRDEHRDVSGEGQAGVPTGGVFGALFGDEDGVQGRQGDGDDSGEAVRCNRSKEPDPDMSQEYDDDHEPARDGQVSVGASSGDGVCGAERSTGARGDDGYFEGGDGDVCAVCQCGFEDGSYAMVMSRCRHAFHPGCINGWLDRRRTCPCCRDTVVASLSPSKNGAEDPKMGARAAADATRVFSVSDPVIC